MNVLRHYISLIPISLLLIFTSVYGEDKLIVTEARKEIVLTGYTRHINSQRVSSEVAGKVMSVHYDIGQTIGTKPFIEIDTAFIDYELERTSRSIKKNEIAIKKARSQASYLEKEHKRISTLFEDKLATEADLDRARQRFDQADLELQSALSEQALLSTTLDDLRERRRRHKISAPRGWIVTKRDIEEGEVVQPGTPLAEVSDYRKLVVPLSVSHEELSTISALPSPFHATLQGIQVRASLNWVNPQFDELTRKITIEILITEYPDENRGGLKFLLPLNVSSAGIYVPKKAVSLRYENPAVIIRQTEEVVNLLVLGDEGDHLIAGEDDRLKPGTELLPQGNNF